MFSNLIPESRVDFETSGVERDDTDNPTDALKYWQDKYQFSK